MDREQLVEKMAEAAWGPYGGLRSLTQQQREMALADMKRALAVAEPVIRERAAAEADALLSDSLTDSRNPINVVRELATKIRTGGTP